MKLTEFFRLRMPDGTDPVNIEDFNDNFEVIDRELEKRISNDESASDVTVEFKVAESRQPLKSGEKLSVLMGKAQRFFTDLKTVAFSGKYGDLSERPTLGGAAGYKVADNDTTNSSEFLPTARVTYEHGLEIDALSRDLTRVNVYVGGDGKLHFVNSGGADSALPFSSVASSGKLLKQFYGIGTGQGAEGYVTNTYQISQTDKNSDYKCYILTVSTVYIDMVTWEGCDISISNGGKKISETVYDGISVSNGSLGSVKGMRLKTFVWMLHGNAPVGSTFEIRARGVFIGQIVGVL